MVGVRAQIVFAAVLIAGCSSQLLPTPVTVYTPPPLGQSASIAPVQQFEPSAIAPVEEEKPCQASPCRISTLQINTDHRFDGRWNLTRIGVASPPQRFRRVHLIINGDSISGNDGCNSFSQQGIPLQSAVTTAMQCTDASTVDIDFEDVFNEDPSDGVLLLRSRNGHGTVRFERISPAQ